MNKGLSKDGKTLNYIHIPPGPLLKTDVHALILAALRPLCNEVTPTTDADLKNILPGIRALEDKATYAYLMDFVELADRRARRQKEAGEGDTPATRGLAQLCKEYLAICTEWQRSQ